MPSQNPERNQGRRNADGTLDKNDPMNYVGGKFLEEDGYQNNVLTKLSQKPKHYPFGNWQEIKGTSYHRKVWVPHDKDREEIRARRRLERDPNHPMWEEQFGLLKWWHIRIKLLGSDLEGRQIVVIRKGESEPIYIRFGRLVEVFYRGKNILKMEE